MPQTGASARNEQRLPEPHSRPRYTASGADLGEVLLRRSRRSRHSNRPRFHLGGRPPQSGAGLVGAQGLLMTHQSDTQCLGGRTQWRVARGSPGRWRLLELPLELAAGPCDLYRLPVAIHRPPNTTVTVCPVPAATHTQLHLHDRHLEARLAINRPSRGYGQLDRHGFDRQLDIPRWRPPPGLSTGRHATIRSPPPAPDHPPVPGPASPPPGLDLVRPRHQCLAMISDPPLLEHPDDQLCRCRQRPHAAPRCS
jgi:hypothetical protein